MQNFQQNEQSGGWNSAFMDAINLLSFMIGVENLQLNVTSADLDRQTNQILSEVHGHLKEQDDHLILQDRHLVDQDKRIDRLERLVLEMSNRQKGDNNNG